MKSILFGLLFAAALLHTQAQDDAKPKDGDIKIYKRLIPADVLRGECWQSSHGPDLIIVCGRSVGNKAKLRPRFTESMCGESVIAVTSAE